LFSFVSNVSSQEECFSILGGKIIGRSPAVGAVGSTTAGRAKARCRLIKSP